MHTLLMSVHYEHVSNIAFDAVHCKYVVICVIVLIIVHIQESPLSWSVIGVSLKHPNILFNNIQTYYSAVWQWWLKWDAVSFSGICINSKHAISAL